MGYMIDGLSVYYMNNKIPLVYPCSVCEYDHINIASTVQIHIRYYMKF